MDFRRRLAGPPILADGAMGTELYARGVYVNRCFDELNLSQMDLVSRIHSDYLRAGSELIETNTFGANRCKLAPHGFGDKVERINELGAKIALQAVEKCAVNAYVAGSIGPLGRRLAPLGKMPVNEAREAFAEQARGLVKGGVDLIMIETMIDPVELKIAVEAVRGTTDLCAVYTEGLERNGLRRYVGKDCRRYRTPGCRRDRHQLLNRSEQASRSS